MLRIALLGIRGRMGAFTGAFVALMVAAALVMACGVLLESGLRAKAPVERYRGADAVVTGEQSVRVRLGSEDEESVLLPERARVDAGIVGRIAATPGVRAAIADDSVPARLLAGGAAVPGPTGHPTSVHPWSAAALTPYGLRAGRAPAAADEVVVDAGLAARGHLRPGRRVRLAATGPAERVTVVGIAAPRTAVARQAAVFVADAEATRLAGHPGRVDAIGVVAAPGTSPAALRERLGDAAGPRARILTGAGRGRAEYLDVADAREAVIAIAGAFGGLALLIAMFVVASTLGLAIQLREREIALLRAVAATPRQVRRMIGWEALLLALTASLVGLVPGAALGGALGRAFADRGIAPEDMAIHAGPLPAAAAVSAGVLTAWLAVWVAARRAARVQPTRALQDAAVEHRLIGPARVVGGLLALGGAAALLMVSMSAQSLDTAAVTAACISFVLVLAAAFLGPVVARIAAWIPGTLVARSSRVGGFLAVANVRASARRFSSASTPLVLTVAMAGSLLFVSTTQEHATAKQDRERVTADLALRGDAPGLPPSAVTDARRVPGVAAAVGVAATTLGPSLGLDAEPGVAQAVDTDGAARVLDLDVRHGSLADLRGDAVALTVDRAKAAHASVGERVNVMLGDGARVRLRVVATYERGLGFGEAVLPRTLVAAHRTSPLVGAVLIRTAPGADRAAVARRLRALADRYPSMRVADRAALASADDAERASERWLNYVLVAIIVAFSAIAVVNTLTMIAIERSRELALMRLVGSTPRQVAGMARWEAALLVMVGLGLGAAIAAATLVPFSVAIAGTAMPYVPAGQLAAVLGGAAVLGLAASQLPTRLALRAKAVDAIGVRE
jgi:putative ABC transport system permease protein